jgi:hypothetical protein
MHAKKIRGVILGLCVAALAARADSLELKNASLIKGRFMGGTQTSITFQVGSTLGFHFAQVLASGGYGMRNLPGFRLRTL